MLFLADILSVLRPKQWLKSAFVFIGWFYSGLWIEGEKGIDVLVVAVAFALMASAVYVFNDICDRPADSHHPIKATRPIASGRMGLPAAWFLFAMLGLISGLACWLINPEPVSFLGIQLLILLFYLLINIAYSMALKHWPIIDVVLIATGFVLRVLMGTLGIGIAPSIWLLVCVGFLTLFLALCKRRSEVHLIGSDAHKARPTLAFYAHAYIDRVILGLGVICLLVYALYRGAFAIANHEPWWLFVLTVGLACNGLGRFLTLLFQHKVSEPLTVLLQDKISLFNAMLWLGTSAYALTYNQ